MNFEEKFLDIQNTGFTPRTRPTRKLSSNTSFSDTGETSKISSSADSVNLTQSFTSKLSADSQEDSKFGSGALTLLNSNLRNRLTQLGDLGQNNSPQSDGEALSLPATHLNVCSCSACHSGQLHSGGQWIRR